jgi:hypothetical protein
MYGMWVQGYPTMLTFAHIADIRWHQLIYNAIPAMHYNSSSVSCIF